MEAESVRALIREKLADGRLPHNSIPRIWGGPADGETCDACDKEIPKGQFVMEGVSTDLAKRALQFHVACLHLWVLERLTPKRA